MPIEVHEISDKQLEQILRYTEGHFLDVKAKEIQPSKLTKAMSAFANADGGELYVGVVESALEGGPHKWNGFPDPEAANGHIQVFENLFPLGEDYSYTFLRHKAQPGLVLQVIIKKTKAIIKANDGIPYVRRGAQSLPVDTPQKMTLLERNKGISSFENEPVSANISNVCNSETAIRFILDVVPTQEPELWLRKQELIKEDKPTVAGIVLFSDLPQAILPKRSGIKIYRYKTAEIEGRRDTLVGDPLSVEGCAYTLIKQAVEKTQEIISGIRTLGVKGMEQVSYPAETLHEIITNAVLHRDYSIADDVHVRIFDNRVEVESPGRLPAHITPKNVLSERFARNGNLVRVINKFPNPPNKDVGEGLNTAFEAMKKLRLKAPELLEPENSVLVLIKHEKLASAADLVMQYLDNNETITNRDARQMTGIRSENSMKNVFLRLRDANLIEPVPGRSGFASAWRLKKTKTHRAKAPSK